MIKTPYGTFIDIPSGCFLMGNDKPYTTINGENRKEHTHARHVHTVTISKRTAFLETPLTCGAMTLLLDRHPGKIPDALFRFKVYDDPDLDYALGDSIEHPPKTWKDVSTHSYWRDPDNHDLPATGLSWDEAMAFCRFAGQELGVPMRLPTEAEWEHACRAGTSSVYFFGDCTSLVPGHAWCCVNSGLEPKPVGGFGPNPWGLRDVVGNVWEWCQDKYSTTFYGVSPEMDPVCQDDSITERVIRGGSSMNKAETCRSSHRFGLSPAIRDRFLGFRPIIELP